MPLPYFCYLLIKKRKYEKCDDPIGGDAIANGMQ